MGMVFIELQKCLRFDEGNGVALICYEQYAIINVVANVLPHVEYRHYDKHIFSNWRKSFKGDEMKLMFWKATKTYNIVYYNEVMDELEKLNLAATVGFRGSNPKVLCMEFMKTHTKADVIMSNLAKTFNGYIINARTKHLIYMLEDIRT